jgi:glycine betaine/proline transport system substrate-binding protein
MSQSNGWKAPARRAFLAAAISLAALGFAWQPASGAVPESKDPIVIGKLDWTGQEITAEIAGEILRRMGYSVEFVTTTNIPLFQAVADGQINVYLEQWLQATRKPFEEYESQGKLEKIGPLGLEGHEGWYYPDYVEQVCPGLPKWTALKGCEAKFATPETAPKGRFLDYAQEWHPDAPQWISLLGLDFTAVNSGGEGSTAAEVKSAIERKAPILVMSWEPTWLVAEYKLKQVQIAPDDPACKKAKETKVTLKSMNCDAPPVEIVKFANPHFKEKYPAAYKMLKAFTITNAIQGPLMKSVDVEKQKAADAAKKWVDENEAVWKPWVDAAMM